MTDLDKRIDEQLQAILAKYRALQPIRDELDDAIDRMVAEYERLQAELAARDKHFSTDEIEDMGEYAGIEPNQLEAALSYMHDKRKFIARAK